VSGATQQTVRDRVIAERGLNALVGLWRGTYAGAKPGAITLITKLVGTLCLLWRTVTAKDWLRRFPLTGEIWVLTWVTLSFVTLFVAPLDLVRGNRVMTVYVLPVFCGFRIIDIFMYKLEEITLHSLYGADTFHSVQRSFLLTCLNAVETIVAFSTLYLLSRAVAIDQWVPRHEGTMVWFQPTPVYLSNPGDALYFSTVTFFTLGYGDYLPTTTGARLLVCWELSCAAMLLIAFIPLMVSKIAERFAGRSDGNSTT